MSYPFLKKVVYRSEAKTGDQGKESRGKKQSEGRIIVNFGILVLPGKKPKVGGLHTKRQQSGDDTGITVKFREDRVLAGRINDHVKRGEKKIEDPCRDRRYAIDRSLPYKSS